MKNWCKHKFGFVNIDDEFIYFTSTGNWSDTKDLGEFNEAKTKKSSSAERYKSISYFTFVSIVLITILWTIGFKALSYASIIGIAWLGYSAYHYMAPSLTGEFKISHYNIINLEVNPSGAVLTFLDSNEKETVQELTGFDQKGFDLFSELSVLLNTKNIEL